MMMPDVKLYKWLDAKDRVRDDGWRGWRRWREGRWQRAGGTRVFRLYRDDNLSRWISASLWEAEADDVVFDFPAEVVAGREPA